MMKLTETERITAAMQSVSCASLSLILMQSVSRCRRCLPHSHGRRLLIDVFSPARWAGPPADNAM